MSNYIYNLLAGTAGLHAGLNVQNVVVSDWNKDGRLDIIVTNLGHSNEKDGTIGILLGKGALS